MKQEKTTGEIQELLKNLNPKQLNTFLNDNKSNLKDDKKAFYYYMKDVTESKNIRLMDMYSFAGVSESYGSKIVTMEKHTKNRDLIIRLCIAGHFSLDETNKALRLYGMSSLYSKNKRDACLIVAISSRIFDLAEIDDLLIGSGVPKLSV